MDTAPSPTAPELPRSPRYLCLDAWRGAACLAVVIYHSWLYYASMPDHEVDAATSLLSACAYGRLGVPVFFVISGYCISATADASRRRSTRVRHYFLRRFRRIFPPYWAVLIASAFIIAVTDVLIVPGFLTRNPRMEFRPWWFSPSQWLGNFTLTESWRYHLFGSTRAHYVGQSWTLCYEEQFYAVVGIILLLAAKRFFTAAVVVTAGVIVVELLAWRFDVDIQGFFFDGNWLLFAAGIAVYYYVNYASKSTRLMILATVTLAFLGQIAMRLPIGMDAAVATGFTLVLVTVHPWDSSLANSRFIKPFALCGIMCYSLYLVHQFLVTAAAKSMYANGIRSGTGTMFITIPVCLAISLVAGGAFYWSVERRFLNSKPAK